MGDDIFERTNSPLLIMLSGTAGAGKDSVIRRMKERDIPFAFVVTVTSRVPRPDEVHGQDYFFVSESEFQEMIREDELLEHALVYNQHKGIPKQQVREALASGKDVILRVDVQGVETIRRQCPQAVAIFLTASSKEELARRLFRRGADTAEQVALRLRTAYEEMKRIPEYDYVVVNADGRLDETVDTIAAIIQAEHARAIPRRVTL
ncbi:MAG: guanylate kinase [Candidatus Aminicenantes bacterium]|nr:guanylate kinase [Candidatus Aminicenantes bacterium]